MVDNLKPGRELDALIAEKVMGWKVDGDTYTDENGRTRAFKSSFEQYEPSVRWSPSTDIAAAWEVMEKFKAKEYLNPEIIWRTTDQCAHPPNVWVCWFGMFGKSAYSESAPHAICLAALKAIGYE